MSSQDVGIILLKNHVQCLICCILGEHVGWIKLRCNMRNRSQFVSMILRRGSMLVRQLASRAVATQAIWTKSCLMEHYLKVKRQSSQGVFQSEAVSTVVAAALLLLPSLPSAQQGPKSHPQMRETVLNKMVRPLKENRHSLLYTKK